MAFSNDIWNDENRWQPLLKEKEVLNTWLKEYFPLSIEEKKHDFKLAATIAALAVISEVATEFHSVRTTGILERIQFTSVRWLGEPGSNDSDIRLMKPARVRKT